MAVFFKYRTYVVNRDTWDRYCKGDIFLWDKGVEYQKMWCY